MQQELIVRIVLQKPPEGVDSGSRRAVDMPMKRYRFSRPMRRPFDLSAPSPSKATARRMRNRVFAGLLSRARRQKKFIYIAIGTYAGQAECIWGGRLKVPLRGITWATIEEVILASTLVLETQVPGSGNDGSPACATVKPFGGWTKVRHL